MRTKLDKTQLPSEREGERDEGGKVAFWLICFLKTAL